MLDWDNATITLPLDEYGMDLAEQRLVRAALSIEFARCVIGSESVSDQVLSEARRALIPVVPDPEATHWLFGIWDATFVAKNGWKPFPDDAPAPVYVDADPITAERCVQAESYISMGLITITNPGEDRVELIAILNADSYMRTFNSSEYARLLGELRSCGESQGYQTLPNSSGGGFVTDQSWSDEQVLKVKLAEATCNDQISLTQTAGNIMATYQLEMIDQHEAELFEIRRIADDRVARAEGILREVGVL
ncbi:MAG: hypothetical protein LBK54_10780 [Propionibacteriaceae bacterium]|jgi:hypothetical protein|nr:hypothetical protein [Propionibacteriaceae bacterium]